MTSNYVRTRFTSHVKLMPNLLFSKIIIYFVKNIYHENKNIVLDRNMTIS